MLIAVASLYIRSIFPSITKHKEHMSLSVHRELMEIWALLWSLSSATAVALDKYDEFSQRGEGGSDLNSKSLN